MISQQKHTGFAVAIAWPETWCKQSGAWYDGFIKRLGISKNHYYKVGHAALVLVNPETKKCHYFDFGRYHTPFQHGRVRSEKTDDGLKINTAAQISEDGKKIKNYEVILNELQQNHECHGEGALHASYGPINFRSAFNKATEMQQNSPLRYGPFRFKGSNCSRFVNYAIAAGKPSWLSTLKLNFFVPLTPTPLNNVQAFTNKIVLPKFLSNPAFCPPPISDKNKLRKTLNEPDRATRIPDKAQWLSGEGAGSWFTIKQKNEAIYIISRFDPEGKLECEGQFEIKNNLSFDIQSSFQFEYLSHCQNVQILQNGNTIEFNRLKNPLL